MTTDPDCLFCKIVANQVPSRKVYEDEQVIAFHDIHPKAPVHLLIVPKLHLASLDEAGPQHEALLGRMLTLAPSLAREQGALNGFRTCINTGRDGGQEIDHIHVHVMGGPQPWKRP